MERSLKADDQRRVHLLKDMQDTLQYKVDEFNRRKGEKFILGLRLEVLELERRKRQGPQSLELQEKLEEMQVIFDTACDAFGRVRRMMSEV